MREGCIIISCIHEQLIVIAVRVYDDEGVCGLRQSILPLVKIARELFDDLFKAG